MAKVYEVKQVVNGEIFSTIVDVDRCERESGGLFFIQSWGRNIEAFFPWDGLVRVIKIEKPKEGTGDGNV